MKFNASAFLAMAFLATVSAWTSTTVYPTNNFNCGSGTYASPISECGKHNLDGYKMASAKIDYHGQGVYFFNKADCTGIADYVEESKDCYPMIYTVKCIYINCH